MEAPHEPDVGALLWRPARRVLRPPIRRALAVPMQDAEGTRRLMQPGAAAGLGGRRCLPPGSGVLSPRRALGQQAMATLAYA